MIYRVKNREMKIELQESQIHQICFIITKLLRNYIQVGFSTMEMTTKLDSSSLFTIISIINNIFKMKSDQNYKIIEFNWFDFSKDIDSIILTPTTIVRDKLNLNNPTIT